MMYVFRIMFLVLICLSGLCASCQADSVCNQFEHLISLWRPRGVAACERMDDFQSQNQSCQWARFWSQKTPWLDRFGSKKLTPKWLRNGFGRVFSEVPRGDRHRPGNPGCLREPLEVRLAPCRGSWDKFCRCGGSGGGGQVTNESGRRQVTLEHFRVFWCWNSPLNPGKYSKVPSRTGVVQCFFVNATWAGGVLVHGVMPRSLYAWTWMATRSAPQKA